jgi:predicted RNase H-like HicB family nuclease
MSTSFSTTIAGKTYTGNVSESDGEYVASDPSLQGATASGSSTTDAENNLTVRIDELV